MAEQFLKKDGKMKTKKNRNNIWDSMNATRTEHDKDLTITLTTMSKKLVETKTSQLLSHSQSFLDCWSLFKLESTLPQKVEVILYWHSMRASQ